MNTTLAAAQAAHEQAQQACATASHALEQAQADRQAAIAAGAPAARLDACDRAIIAASRLVEIGNAGLERAREELAATEQAAEAAEVERLHAERLGLVRAVNAAAELIEQHVAEARAAVASYTAAMQGLAHFTSLHADRLRLHPLGAAPRITVEMTVPGWATQTAPIGRVPRL